MSSHSRERVIGAVAERILALKTPPLLRVAIDGVDGAGKTVFADALAKHLTRSGRQIIRSSVDGFHNPRLVRYRFGKDSPDGFFIYSYNYTALARNLLDPLAPGGSRKFRRAYFDHAKDTEVEAPEETATPDAILVFDGIFLSRLELRGVWDCSVFLQVDFENSIPRVAARDRLPADAADPNAPRNRRYVEGQKLYLSACRPAAAASLVIDNNDFENPRILVAR